MSDEIDKLGRSMDDTSEQLDAYNKAQNAALQQEEQRNKKNDELKRAAADFAKGIGQFSSALMSNVDNQAKYGDSVQSMTNGIASVVKQIPLVGTVLGLLLEAFGAAAKKVLEYNDALVSTNRKLGEVGQSTGLSTDELINLAHRVGFSSKNLDKYTKVMSNMGNSMLYFGKTASDGAKTFTAMAAVTDDQREAFTRLGYGTEETLEAIGEYAKLQGTLGKNSAADFKSLKAGTLKYAETLSELSALTGESKKTIQARQQAAANDLKYNLEIQRLQESGQGKIAEEMGKLVGVTGAQAEGMRAWLSGAGNTSEAGRQLFKLTGSKIDGIMSRFKSGQLTYDQAQKEVGAAIRETTSGFGHEALILTDLAKELGYNVETQNEYNRARNSDAKAAQAEVKNKVKSGDSILDAEAARINAEINAGIAYDKIIGLVAGPVNSVMQKLFEAAGKLADMITRFIDWLPSVTRWFKSKGNSGANDPDFSNAASGTVGANYGQGEGEDPVQNPEQAKEMYKYLRGQGLDHNKAVGAVAALQGVSDSDMGTGGWKGKVDSLLTSGAGKKFATSTFSDAGRAASNFADSVINTDTGWMAAGKKILDGKGGAASYKATGLDALLKSAETTAAPAQKQAKQGAMLSAPLSGYNVEMHGEEMVIPLGDGRSIPVTMQGGGISSEVITLMIERLQSISDIIKQSNSTEEEVLRHARNA